VITRLADSARAANLPADALIAKAAEGVLKGADEQRILRAVRTLYAELTDARAALPSNAGTTLLTAAASALHAGVPRATLTKIVSAGAKTETDLAIGLVAVADLAASGVPANRASDAIVELLRRHAPESDITALRAGVATDIANGRAPESALGARMQGLLRVIEARK
jgi:hypothetical protein